MNRLTAFSGRRLFTPSANKTMIPKRYASTTASPSEVAAKLSKETGLQQEYIEDADLHIIMLKTDRLFKKLGLNDEESQNDFLNKYLLSPGHPTLEWALPTPPPIHTFEELPLIKEHGAAHH